MSVFGVESSVFLLTWCRQLGRELKLCTWVSPNRQLRKQWRAAWDSPCCWSCCPSSNRPSLPPVSIPSPSQSQQRLPSELHRPRTDAPLSPPLLWSTTGRKKQSERFVLNVAAHINTDREKAQGGVSSTASSQSRRNSVSQGQVVRSRLKELRQLTEKYTFPSLLPGCTRKGGQRKSGSICCLSDRAMDQSLLCSCIVALPACVSHLVSLQSW